MKYLSITEVAKALNTSRQWVWMLVKSQQLYSERVGNQFIIPEEEFIRYKNQQSNKPLNGVN